MASVWGELKRRNVVKVAVAYAIVAWLIVQVIVSIEAPLNLPDWADTLVIVILGVGFVVALFMAWAYELTPGGIEKTRSIPLSDSIGNVIGRKLDFAIIASLTVALAFALFSRENSEPAVDVATGNATQAIVDTTSETTESAEERATILPDSVAVLPFQNLSPDEADAYFATGLHDEILNQLAKLGSLSVISRTSVARYASSDLSIPEIARELNVESVMEGSVRYADDQVRITVQLIDARTDGHIWSETYDREFSDIFAIESDIAVSVAEALEAELSPLELANVEEPPTSSPSAYALYLQALSPENENLDVEARLELLDRAISFDPEFAMAYAAKAAIYVNTYVSTTASMSAAAEELDELSRVIRDNAETALSIDPGATLAHGALGQLNAQRWRWTEARESYAAADSVGVATAWLSAYMGLPEEAVRIAQRAIELNPGTLEAYRSSGVTYALIGNAEAALVAMLSAVELNPTDILAHAYIGFMEIVRGNPDVALRELQLADQLMEEFPILPVMSELTLAYNLLGREDDARRLFSKIEGFSLDRDIGAGTWALVNLGVGDREAALEWLTVGAERAEGLVPDPGFYPLMFIRMNVLRAPILEEPEFVALRERLTGI